MAALLCQCKEPGCRCLNPLSQDEQVIKVCAFCELGAHDLKLLPYEEDGTQEIPF